MTAGTQVSTAPPRLTFERAGWAVALIAASAMTVSVLGVPAHAATSRAVQFLTYAAFAQVGAEITVRGSVTSTPSGANVEIQELQGESWTGISTVSTDADGVFSHSFAPTSAGKVSFRAVAPADGDLDEATSAVKVISVAEAPATPFDSAPIPTMSGSQTVGSVLTTQSALWSPAPASYKYQWMRDGKPIPVFTRRYQITGDDLGKHLTVAVGATRDGAMTIRESKPVEPVERGTFTTQTPLITGTAEVGQTVKADIAKWFPQPNTISYQWRRNGNAISAARDADYLITAREAGTELTVEVSGESAGIDSVTRTSDPVLVVGDPSTPSDMTFGDIIRPRSTEVIPESEATFTAIHELPSWGKNKLTRWDQSGAFTHSLRPRAMGTLYSDYYGYNIANPSTGAEYVASNSTFKNADVEFQITATTFAINYKTYKRSDAMVWIDDQPISSTPIAGWDGTTNGSGSRNWIVVTLPERKKVTVRFAGPLVFTGVDTPAADAAVISAARSRFTLGVDADSFFEPCYDTTCQSRSAAPTMSSLSGFRVWNMAEAATGYVNDGSGLFGRQTGDGKGVEGHHSSAFGSARRVEAIRTAPIDALLVSGSANDQKSWTPAQHRDAVDAFLSELERVRPNLPVILVGIQGIPYTRSATRFAHYKALNDNLAAMVETHPNVVGFIDGFTDPWFSDANFDQYIGFDGAHPNGEGQAYFQGRIVDELTEMPLPASAAP